jgi:hypothetical protein
LENNNVAGNHKKIKIALKKFLHNYSFYISFLFKKKIFTEAQNSFRKGKCIEATVQSFIEIIQEALDKRVHTIGIFIDLTRAYDILNHKLLLEKLSSYGISGSKNSWFRSYLTNRRQFIEINQCDSSSVKVNRYTVGLLL